VKLRAHLGVYLVCLTLVAVWTWPLARDPAHLVPNNTDPRLFSWVMISVFRNLLTRPHLLLDGSGFYPYGLSLTLAEPLLTPALTMGPLFWWTGNPYLAYNVTLLLSGPRPDGRCTRSRTGSPVGTRRRRWRC
jgi:hypothetical protein